MSYGIVSTFLFFLKTKLVVVSLGYLYARPSAWPLLNIGRNFVKPFLLFKKKQKKQGDQVGPQIFWAGILIFLWVRGPSKISWPYDNPFWENSYTGRRKKREGKFKKNIDLPKFAPLLHALRLDQNHL